MDKPHAQISLKDFDAWLRVERRLMAWQYPLDRDFKFFAFAEITSLADALAFADRLDQQANERRRGDTCTKAYQVRRYLEKPAWSGDLLSIRYAVAIARRTCCICHETGSYSRRQDN